MEHFQTLIRQTLQTHLDLEVWNNGAQVRIAATLAVTVHGSLDMRASTSYCRQGIGYSHLAVIMGVDTKGNGYLFLHCCDNILDLKRQGPAVGVAQYHAF